MKKRSLKLLSMTLALVMLLGMLTGCGGNNSGDKDSGSNGGNSDNGGAAYDALNIMFVVTGSLGGGTNNDDVYSALSDYTTAYGVRTYQVTSIETVSVYDTSGLAQDGTFKLTMYTCQANQPDVKLKVVATLVG